MKFQDWNYIPWPHSSPWPLHCPRPWQIKPRLWLQHLVNRNIDPGGNHRIDTRDILRTPSLDNQWEGINLDRVVGIYLTCEWFSAPLLVRYFLLYSYCPSVILFLVWIWRPTKQVRFVHPFHCHPLPLKRVSLWTSDTLNASGIREVSGLVCIPRILNQRIWRKQRFSISQRKWNGASSFQLAYGSL